MKFRIQEHPYAITNIAFILIGIFGGWYQDWDATTLSFLLGLYLVVVIGIRLDDIQKQIGTAQQALQDGNALEHMENIEAKLTEISQKLDRVLKQHHS